MRIASVARQPAHQESHLREHDHDEELETDPGTALDNRLRREQAEAFLELTAAHRSRVHGVPPPSDKEKPCD
jgi:hypothetical protein